MAVGGENQERFTPAEQPKKDNDNDIPIPAYATEEADNKPAKNADSPFVKEGFVGGMTFEVLHIILLVLKNVLLFTFAIALFIIKIPIAILKGVIRFLSIFAIMTFSRIFAGVFVLALFMFGGQFYLSQKGGGMDSPMGGIFDQLGSFMEMPTDIFSSFTGGDLGGQLKTVTDSVGSFPIGAEMFAGKVGQYPEAVQGFVEVAIQHPELLQALAQYDGEEASDGGAALVPLMTQMLYHEDDTLRTEAYKSLQVVNTPEAQQALYDYMQAVKKAGAQ